MVDAISWTNFQAGMPVMDCPATLDRLISHSPREAACSISTAAVGAKAIARPAIKWRHRG